MKNFILGKVLAFIGRKFDGKKTLIGGLGAIFFGLAGLINVMWPGTIPGIKLDVDQAIASISAGFLGLGLGSKIQKNTAAVVASGCGPGAASSPPENVIILSSPPQTGA